MNSCDTPSCQARRSRIVVSRLASGSFICMALGWIGSCAWVIGAGNFDRWVALGHGSLTISFRPAYVRAVADANDDQLGVWCRLVNPQVDMRDRLGLRFVAADRNAIEIPMWLITVFSGAAAWFLRRRPVSIGHCLRCGYALNGNTSGRCPECGTTVPTVRLDECLASACHSTVTLPSR